MGRTGRRDIDRLVEGLEASFEVGRLVQDEVVANDLAHTLRHGRDLADVLATGSWRVATGGGSFDIEVVAADHVACCSRRLLIPLRRGLFGRGDRGRPVRSTATLRRALTRATRTRTTVRIETVERVVEGRLGAVGADYVEITGTGGTVLVPLAAAASFRLSREGSVDVS